MAVSEQTPYKEYTANGSASSFALEFDCENQDHLIVLVDDVEPVVGTWSLIGGAVVFGTAPINGKKITIQRNTPVLRSTNFQSFNNSFRPDAINKDLDRVWLRLQEEGVAKFLLNQLINMNYEDLNEKGQNIRTELIDELTIQADELDQKIQTTASQLNSQIIQQGVSQQQLQNYYSFLQGQMANLSSDKNWVSSLIADASGKNQQQINIEQNFKNAEILTPEMFGGKGDGITDDTVAVLTMLKACTDMPTGSGITAATINAKLNSNNFKKIRLTRLYRVTKPIYLPPNIMTEQCFAGFFVRKAGNIGIFYDPIDSELNTFGVSTCVYKKDSDGTYHLDTDPFTLPTGAEFDYGTYIQTGQRILLDGFSVITKYGVTLGCRFVGMAGSIVNYLNVGTNDSSSPYIPKVAVLTSGCWNTTFNKPTTLSSVQGWVNRGSNGGLTIANPYINQGFNATNQDEITPLYALPDYIEKGSIAVTNSADAFWYQPITEHWRFNYVNSGYLRVFHPHIEGGISRNNFYFVGVGAGGDITLKGNNYVTREEKSSLIYLKNCDIQSSITLRGRLLGGDPVVRGENSSACVSIDVDRNHFFIQVGKWGDLSLIRSINNTWAEKAIYVDPLAGNDEAVGLRDINALKTFANVKRLAELMNIRIVQVVSNIDVAGFVDIHANAVFTGQKINVTGSSGLRFNAKTIDVHFNNTELSSAAGTAPIQVTGTSAGLFGVTCNLANLGPLITCSSNAVLDLNIATNTLPNSDFVFGSGAKQFVSVNLNTSATYTGSSVSGTAILVEAPHLVASAAVVGSSIPANSRTAVSTLNLNGCRLGQAVKLSYDKNLIGLDVNGYVSASNTVSYYFDNKTAAPITLSDGNVIAKVVL